MNKALKFIKDLRAELSESKLDEIILSGLLDSWDKLKIQIQNEDLYAIGLYCGNMGFGYLSFTGNTNQGLSEKIQKYKEDDYYANDTEEEIRLRLKWSAADWKYHDTIVSKGLEQASEILTDITERMYGIEECDPELDILTDEQMDEIYEKGRSKYEVVPDYLYYDLQDDIFDPGHQLIYDVLKKSLLDFKNLTGFGNDVVVGMFCGDASYDFMLENCIPINDKTAVKSIIDDLNNLGKITNIHYLEGNYIEFEN